MSSRKKEANGFPKGLGVMVADAVMRGKQPILYVAHIPDGDWWISDGLTPNDPDLVHVAHMSRAVDLDPSLQELASLPAGQEAYRNGANESWQTGPFAWADE